MNNSPDDVPRARALRDVIYGPFARNRLDVYPARSSGEPAPVVLFFHGGSWRKGDKRLYSLLGRALSRRGFMAVIPNYRLFPEVLWPDFMGDAGLAVAWTRRNAGRFGGDPHQIHVMGHSAGAHMATLLGLDEEYLEPAALSPADLRSVIGISGPYSMDPLEIEAVRPIFENAPDLDRIKPVNLVHGDGPPMLLMHGQRDGTVPALQADILHDALRRIGGRAHKIIYPGLGHIEILLTLTPFYRWRAPAVLRDILTFLQVPGAPVVNGAGKARAHLLVPQSGARKASG